MLSRGSARRDGRSGTSARLQTRRLEASSASEIDAAFATIGEDRDDAVMVGTDGFFVDRRDHIVALAMRYKVAGIFPFPSFPEVGGLMSYGASLNVRVAQTGEPSGLAVRQGLRVTAHRLDEQ
jgi:hypothetical protein